MSSGPHGQPAAVRDEGGPRAEGDPPAGRVPEASRGSARPATLTRWLPLFAVSLVVLAAIASGHYAVSVRLAGAAREASERAQLGFAEAVLERAVDAVVSDLRFVAESGSRQGWFEAAAGAARAALTENLRLLVETKRIYDQARFLDLRGMEVARANLERGEAVVVPGSRLQDKSGRYYFERAVPLARGAIDISPLDLNVEHDKIEVPVKPVLRVSTAVFDRDGRKTGVLILNVRGESLLQGFHQAAAGIADRVMLLNADGFWLSSPQPEDEWGFMFGVERTFATDYPVAWKRIQAEESGRFRDDGNTFAFATVHVGASPGAGAGGGGLTWKIVALGSTPDLSAAARDFLARNLVLYAGMVLLAAAGALVTARVAAHRRRERHLPGR